MYTIKQFCAYAQISERQFHVFKDQFRGPDLTRIGRNLRITHEAAAEWVNSNREVSKRAHSLETVLGDDPKSPTRFTVTKESPCEVRHSILLEM